MAACAHGAGYESCPPTKVAKEFNAADKGSGVLRKKKKAKRSLREAIEDAMEQQGKDRDD